MQALEVSTLVKNYPHLCALKGINLTVAQGDFFALLGPNGAGKSTTIGIISSLIKKTSGTVRVFGHDLDHELDHAKACLGVVPQEMNFNPFEKIEHIMANQAGYYGIPRARAMERAEYYLQKMGLWEKRKLPALRLSGGMKRRLLIARALVNDPKLLILDEPTAGVDIELRHTLWEFLAELNQQGTTIILTTHYLEEAERLCNNVAIIDQGDIIENANMKTLMARMSTQTLLLDVENPPGAAALQTLAAYNARLIEDTTLEVRLTTSQSVNDLIANFSSLRITIKGIRNKTSRLEELFIDTITDNHNKDAEA